jgi:transcriptional regulator with XRE-family HTH domain
VPIMPGMDEESLVVRRALYADVGERIRATRNAAGISRAHLAYDIGVSEKTIVRMELGHFSPDLYILGLIAQVCGVPLVTLIPVALPVPEVGDGG